MKQHITQPMKTHSNIALAGFSDIFLARKEEVDQGLKRAYQEMRDLQSHLRASLFTLSNGEQDPNEALIELHSQIKLTTNQIFSTTIHAKERSMHLEARYRPLPAHRQQLISEHSAALKKEKLIFALGISKVSHPVNSKLEVMKKLVEEQNELRSLYEEMPNGTNSYRKVMKAIKHKVREEMDDEEI